MTPHEEQPLYLSQMAGTPRRRTGRIALIAAGGVVLIAATATATVVLMRPPATTAANAGQQQALPVATATTPGAQVAAPPSPASAASAGALKLGSKADGPSVTAVAYSYKQPVATKEPRPDAEGMEWGAADIEVCVKQDGAVSRDSWLLIYADHTTIDPSGTGYGGFPAPAYPWDRREVVAGECVRGWLTFAVPIGRKPIAVRYQPKAMRAEWTVA